MTCKQDGQPEQDDALQGVDRLQHHQPVTEQCQEDGRDTQTIRQSPTTTGAVARYDSVPLGNIIVPGLTQRYSGNNHVRDKADEHSRAELMTTGGQDQAEHMLPCMQIEQEGALQEVSLLQHSGAEGAWAGRAKHLSDISAESAAFRLDGGSREGRPVGLTQEAGAGLNIFLTRGE